MKKVLIQTTCEATVLEGWLMSVPDDMDILKEIDYEGLNNLLNHPDIVVLSVEEEVSEEGERLLVKWEALDQ